MHALCYRNHKLRRVGGDVVAVQRIERDLRRGGVNANATEVGERRTFDGNAQGHYEGHRDGALIQRRGKLAGECQPIVGVSGHKRRFREAGCGSQRLGPPDHPIIIALVFPHLDQRTCSIQSA